jgi:predicted RNase H-like nuclease
MYFVGLDLAWGQVNPTGLAVLDAGGCLEYIDASITDADIVTALAPYVDGHCLVAIDAPLVVNNPTGRRLAEVKLNADFQRFDAGAHPANTGMAVFSGTPRGARLAETLGLDIGPHSTAPRRAIEVYPHPATVALFRLGRTLKYKRGSLSDRRAALLKLMQLIEGLAESAQPMQVTANDKWARLRETVRRARRPIDLDRAEDPIDAVVCAYIALYATRRSDDITIYGDLTNGYIVTPTLPPDLKPAPRRPASTAAKSGRARVAAETERRVTGDDHSPALGGHARGGHALGGHALGG